MEFTTLLFNIENQIATITINRPDKMNALNKDVIAELSRAFDEVYTNSSIRSVILTGSGAKAFVAGADISEFLSLDTAGGASLARVGQETVFNKIENCPKPVVAAVNGFALGGGCEPRINSRLWRNTTLDLISWKRKSNGIVYDIPHGGRQ